MKKNKFLLIVMTMLLSIVTSCHDELNTVPLSTLAPENFFNDLEESEIAVNGLYDKMADHYRQNFIYMSDHGSHVATMLFNNTNLNLYAWYTFSNSDRFVTATWATGYEAIYRSNLVINQVGQLDTDDDVLKNRIIAEAKFLRAREPRGMDPHPRPKPKSRNMCSKCRNHKKYEVWTLIVKNKCENGKNVQRNSVLEELVNASNGAFC